VKDQSRDLKAELDLTRGSVRWATGEEVALVGGGNFGYRPSCRGVGGSKCGLYPCQKLEFNGTDKPSSHEVLKTNVQKVKISYHPLPDIPSPFLFFFPFGFFTFSSLKILQPLLLGHLHLVCLPVLPIISVHLWPKTYPCVNVSQIYSSAPTFLRNMRQESNCVFDIICVLNKYFKLTCSK
jgi:hypothetical protein